MFKINKDKSIFITRGDAARFPVGITVGGSGEPYMFRAGDVVRFRVFERKGCDCVVLEKDVVADREMEFVVICLTSEDTRIGDIIHKPKEYWYEVELNPGTEPQTVIGYDEKGAKIFRLFPEGKE